jgi:hypothetical protein
LTIWATSRRRLGWCSHLDPVCAHGNDTLRQPALVMASSSLTRLVVTDRDDPRRPVGVVSLQQLLEGRVRDLHEATPRSVSCTCVRLGSAA